MQLGGLTDGVLQPLQVIQWNFHLCLGFLEGLSHTVV